MERSICSIIVTYHPTTEMIANLPRVLAQVQALVVIDNGSRPNEIAALRAASESLGFQLIDNGRNVGIAAALNQGVLWAKQQGFPWVILFDQDSKITDGFIDQMWATWLAHPERDRVCSLHPKYVNPETGVEPYVFRAQDGGPITSLTSGAMMPTWVFDKLGLFESDYFIDEVDTEYCLRIRASGFLVADSRTAVLLHTVGHPRLFRFLSFSCSPTYQSPMRRYYMTRNLIILERKYLGIFPRWCLHRLYRCGREAVKCLLMETNRPRKFRSFALGVWDGISGRMGFREGL